jgi:hypothetical protein
LCFGFVLAFVDMFRFWLQLHKNDKLFTLKQTHEPLRQWAMSLVPALTMETQNVLLRNELRRDT